MRSVFGLFGRLVADTVEMFRLIIHELLLSGDVFTALLIIVGLLIWTIAFGLGAYLALRAAGSAFGRIG